MASGTANSSVSPSPSSTPGGGQQSERFIERQLGKTRVNVKLVELSTAGLILLGSVLTLLFLAILVDHWVVDIGTIGRWCLLVLLLLGIAAYVVRFMLPLVIKRINPLYAARTIEQSSPSLKNSLINYLSFRGTSTSTGRLVVNAMRQRAASDLTTVNVDTVVDRSHLIRIGYFVVAMMVALAAYTILSPKDAFQSVVRVATPWADIARPSRVEITEVQPGDAEVTYGQHVTISALVSGVDEDESVRLLLTTDDKQAVDREVIMQQPQESRRFECTLPSTDEGIRQGLVYRIEAGDARTPDFRLSVLPAPTILVQQVDYQFPAYTRQQPKTIKRRGDINALEGTRVTVHARASQPIQTGFIEFNPSGQRSDGQNREVYRLQVDDGDPTLATYSFLLRLDDDRRTPQYSSYQLSFETPDRQRSQETVVYRIHVSRDLAPEIAILTPTRDRIEVPENGSQEIEIRAVDPDYGLSRIQLRAVATGEELLDEALLDEPQGRSGQTISTYSFAPQRLGLVAGDTVVYWAIAEDNRVDPEGTPDPNAQRTRNYEMTIVAADPRAERIQGEPTPAKPPQPDQSGQGEEDGQQEGQEGQEGEGQQGEGQQGAGTEGGDSEGTAGGQQEGQSSQADQSGQDQPGEGAGQGAGQAGAEPQADDAAQPQGGSMQGGSQGNESADASADQTSDNGEQTGDGAQQEPQPGQASPSSAADSGSGSSADPQGGQPSAGQTSQPGQASSPDQRTEPLHDGEAFEQMLEHIRQKQDAGQDRGTPDVGQSSEQTGAPDQQQPQNGSSAEQNPASSGSQDMPQPQGAETPGSQTSQPGQDNQTSGSDSQQGTPGQSPTDTGSSAMQDSATGAAEQPKEPGAPAGSSGSTAPTGDPSSDSAASDADQQSPGDAGQPSGGKQSEQGDPSSEAQSQEEGSQEGAGDQSQAESQSNQASSKQGESSGQGSESGSSPEAGSSPAATPQGAPSNQGRSTDQAGDQPDGQPDQGDQGAAGQQAGQSQPADEGQPGPDSDREPQGDQDNQMQQSSPPQDDQQTSDNAGGNRSSSQGGGVPNETDTSRPRPSEDVPDGDAANLKYARKATDLVLEQLQDDQQLPDDELLDKLGWTPQELRAFLQRWERMKKAAREGGVDEQAELDDALRSLGLRPSGQNRRRGGTRDDQLRGLRDAGSRSRPPAEFLDQFDAYKKGAARAAGQRRP